MPLVNGLYEQIINKDLDKKLAETDQISDIASIDAAEASKLLAKYVAEVVEKGLDNIQESGGDIHSQIELVNQIVNTISIKTNESEFDNLSVAERAEQLLALLDKKDVIQAVNKKIKVIRPETSIAQSSLFTGSVHEPQMYSELKKGDSFR